MGFLDLRETSPPIGLHAEGVPTIGYHDMDNAVLSDHRIMTQNGHASTGHILPEYPGLIVRKTRYMENLTDESGVRRYAQQTNIHFSILEAFGIHIAPHRYVEVLPDRDQPLAFPAGDLITTERRLPSFREIDLESPNDLGFIANALDVISTYYINRYNESGNNLVLSAISSLDQWGIYTPDGGLPALTMASEPGLEDVFKYDVSGAGIKVPTNFFLAGIGTLANNTEKASELAQGTPYESALQNIRWRVNVALPPPINPDDPLQF